jgi:hypothetical protein
MIDRRFTGDDERRSRHATAVHEHVECRDHQRAFRDSVEGQRCRHQRAKLSDPEAAPVREPRNRARDFGPQSQRRFSKKHGPKQPRDTRVGFMPLLEMPSRTRRGCEHQGGGSRGFRRRKSESSEASERNPAHSGSIDVADIERAPYLARVIVEAERAIESRS